MKAMCLEVSPNVDYSNFLTSPPDLGFGVPCEYNEPDICPAATGLQAGIQSQSECPGEFEGLKVKFYTGFEVLETPTPQPQAVSQINFGASGTAWPLPTETPVPPDRLSASFTGGITFGGLEATPGPLPQGFQFVIDHLMEYDGIRLWIYDPNVTSNPAPVVDTWNPDNPQLVVTPPAGLAWGTQYEFRLEYYHYDREQATTPPTLRLRYQTDDETPAIIPVDWFDPMGPDLSDFDPEGSFAKLAECEAGKVTLVPVFPGRSNETYDMYAVAQDEGEDPAHFWHQLENQSGLILHDGPTINARRIAVIPWDTTITVDAYITFPQTNSNDQLWYRVTEFSQGNIVYRYHDPDGPEPLDWYLEAGSEDEALLALLRQAVDIWITVRYPDWDEQSNQAHYFNYVIGVDEDKHPCSNLSDITGSSTETVTFIYDRESAARYAIAHAYRNSVQGSSPYPEQSSRVTSSLANNNPLIPLANGIELANPFSSNLPYAYFIYLSQVVFQNGAYVSGKTGSAMFTSQAYWMGGFPMTFDIPNESLECPAVAELAETGWRYCSNDQVASYGWRDHGGLTTYYSSSLNPIINQDDGVILTSYFPYEEDTWGLIRDGFPTLTILENRQSFYAEYFDPNSSSQFRFANIQSVELGDYIFINRPIANPLGHGFLIVGWGEITSCTNALGRLWTYDIASNSNQGQLFIDFTSANDNLVVPYVVDFSGGISYSQLQRPSPRPFYCAQHANPNFFTLNDSYAFYSFPDVAVTLKASELFTPTNWNWGS